MFEDLLFLLFAIVTTACCIWLGSLAWRAAAPKSMEQRIRSAARRPVAGAAARVMPSQRAWYPASPRGGKWLLASGLIRSAVLRLRHLQAAAGSSAGPRSFLLWSATWGLVAMTLAEWFDAVAWAAALCSCFAACLPLMNLLRQRANRLQAIEAQLPDSLDAMARAMQAGRVFSSALRTTAQEGPAPIAEEWRITADEIGFGLSEEAALTNLAARVKLGDMRYFVAAVMIQREAGGNLAQLLTNLSALVRERSALRGSVLVMSAEGRISAWILGSMPFVIAGLVSLMNPKFLSVLWTDPVGVNLVCAALTSIAIGAFWMWNLIRIRQ